MKKKIKFKNKLPPEAPPEPLRVEVKEVFNSKTQRWEEVPVKVYPTAGRPPDPRPTARQSRGTAVLLREQLPNYNALRGKK